MQQPTAPVAQRLRTVRRWVLAGVIAAFVAAWVAVAAFGKGGTSSPASSAPSTPDPSPGTTRTEPDSGGTFGEPGRQQPSEPGPATTGQS